MKSAEMLLLKPSAMWGWGRECVSRKFAARRKRLPRVLNLMFPTMLNALLSEAVPLVKGRSLVVTVGQRVEEMLPDRLVPWVSVSSMFETSFYRICFNSVERR